MGNGRFSGGMDDPTYKIVVEPLLADTSTHLMVTDEAGNTSDDVIHPVH
ncbi:hypothetical protein [Brevibacillus sp. NRS-1366]